jgi:hypothetical protein
MNQSIGFGRTVPRIAKKIESQILFLDQRSIIFR